MHFPLSRTLSFIFFCLVLLGCQKDEVEPLTAEFTTQYLGRGTVSFSATSNLATEYVWDFGDGDIKQSSNAGAVHTYSKNGKYQVRMTARTAEGRSKDVINTVTIDDIPTTGQGSIFTTVSNTGGYIEVSIGGVYEGRITVYYQPSNTNIPCGDTGNVTFTRPAGSYAYQAKSKNGKSWSGFITIINGECSKLRLID